MARQKANIVVPFSSSSSSSSSSSEKLENLSFEELGIQSELIRVAQQEFGWYEPTAIQTLAIPHLLSSSQREKNYYESDQEQNNDNSVWCQAPTGSGKTAAFVLPLMQNLNSLPRHAHGGIASIVLSPTRELAEQTASVIQLLNNRKKRNKFNVMVLHGGTPLEPQIVELTEYVNGSKQTLHVLIATPGRLVDLMTRYDESRDNKNDGKHYDAKMEALESRLLSAMGKKSSLSLEQISKLSLNKNEDDGRSKISTLMQQKPISYLVIDEADRVLGQGFRAEMDQLLPLFTFTPKNTWLVSATFPKAIEPRVHQVLKDLGCNIQKNPTLKLSCQHTYSGDNDDNDDDDEQVSISLQKRLDRVKQEQSNISVTSPITASPAIKLRTIRMEKRDRTQALRRLLETNDWSRVLVFVATRYTSEHVTRKLRRLGISSMELHGKLDQEERSRRLKQFQQGYSRHRVLIATDLASRGLDIVGLPVVVNYDLPRSTVDFVHRIGRTGRAGHSGTAITFITPESEFHYNLIERRHLSQNRGQIVEREVLVGLEPDESNWQIGVDASKRVVPGSLPSTLGLAHDRMFGGIKGKRKSKKDRLREQAAANEAMEG